MLRSLLTYFYILSLPHYHNSLFLSLTISQALSIPSSIRAKRWPTFPSTLSQKLRWEPEQPLCVCVSVSVRVCVSDCLCVYIYILVLSERPSFHPQYPLYSSVFLYWNSPFTSVYYAYLSSIVRLLHLISLHLSVYHPFLYLFFCIFASLSIYSLCLHCIAPALVSNISCALLLFNATHVPWSTHWIALHLHQQYKSGYLNLNQILINHGYRARQQ